ncbi:hypothetical protein KJ910_04360 [Patescibacteria group bacterium]|nr:hypothetical protein [Patescibacteria group bacterium]MBU1907314.1 hypothetical protein [Patescibacteria group bacterium]
MEGIVIKEDLAGMAQKIQERRAIRYGELKLLAWLLLWPMAIGCVWVVSGLEPKTCLHTVTSLLGVVAIVTVVNSLVPHYIISDVSIYPFLREYWQRNAIGHNAIFWLDRQDEVCCILDWRGTFLFEPGYFPRPVRDLPGNFLVVPLGGFWRRQPYFVTEHRRVIPTKKLLRLRLLEVDVERGQVWLLWRDSEGMRVPMRIEVLLKLVDKNVHWGKVGKSDLRHVVDYLYDDLMSENQQWQARGREIEAKECEIEVLEKNRKFLQTMRTVAINRLVQVVDDIKATSRFGRSKEGREIREGIVCDLPDMMPDDHPARQRIVEQCRRQTNGPSGGEQLPVD